MSEKEKFLKTKHPTLIKIMDLLIPSVDNLLGAGSMGLIIELEKICERYETVYLSVKRIINAIELDPVSRVNGSFIFLDTEIQEAIIENIEVNLSKDFSVVLNAIYSVYYQNIDVRKRINWKYESIQPNGFDMEPWDESVLDKIKERKPFWRDPNN